MSDYSISKEARGYVVYLNGVSIIIFDTTREAVAAVLEAKTASAGSMPRGSHMHLVKVSGSA